MQLFIEIYVKIRCFVFCKVVCVCDNMTKSIDNILKGDITSNVEEFHILKPGISWSPDNKNLVVAVKSNGQDVMFIIDLEDGYKKKKIKLDKKIQAIFQPSWNPVNQNLISFIGSNGAQTDIYIYNLKRDEFIQLLKISALEQIRRTLQRIC